MFVLAHFKPTYRGSAQTLGNVLATKLQDARALWGGIAFLTTGVVLSVMCGLYFYSSATGENYLKSRMFWEIVLNLQVLCISLIWFAYDERIENAQGRWRVRMIVNLVFAIIVNLGPLGFFFYTTYKTWYSNFPSEATIIGIVHAIVLGWLFFELLVQGGFRLITGTILMRSGGETSWTGSRIFGNMWPVMVMVLVLVAAELTGEKLFYVVAPIFGYMKGALDFFNRAYRPPSVTSSMQEPAR